MAIISTAIETGRVRGVLCGNPLYTVFRGIPYAQPSEGANRFAPPKPAVAWEGERLCATFPNICIQSAQMSGNPFSDFFIKEFYPHAYPMGEDSLCLNVWTPANSPTERLPVMVWIHGGGLGSGYGHEMEFDGEAIAKRGVILVTINYRVDVLGWFAHPQLRAENGSTGNLWFLDQLAALQWVRRNIAAFGGDAANVTIFGQSAGGGSVVSHLISPKSRGLFARAIVQSGSGVAAALEGGKDPGAGEAWGVKACEVLGKSVDDLRRMSGKDAFDALKHAEENGAGPCPRQVSDPDVFPVSASRAFMCGTTADVPMMVGSVEGDDDLFPKSYNSEQPLAPQVLGKHLGRYADDFIRSHPIDGIGGAIARQIEALGHTYYDLAIGYGRVESGGAPCYLYRFDPCLPGHNEGPFIRDGLAYHSAEMWYIFGVLGRCWRPFDGRHYDLSQRMTDYWTQFAKTGNPNGDGLPPWPALGAGSKQVLRLNERGIDTMDAGTAELDAYFSRFSEYSRQE